MNPHDPVLSMSEWKSGEATGKTLSVQDRKLATQLAGEAGRLQVDELRSGVRVQATSWVGVTCFEQFSVQVTPKLAGGNVGLVELLAWTTGLDALRPNQSLRTLALDQQGDLFDLHALLFAQTCDRIVRAGVLHDYVELEDDLPVMRGRLLVSQQVRRRFGQVNRLECRFDDHLSDVLENQILAAVLKIFRTRVRHPQVQMQIHRLQNLFASICTDQSLDLAHAFREITYHRLNEHYCEAHTLARQIVDGLQISDLLTAGQARSFAFLLDMNRLFESFIAKVVVHILRDTDCQVFPQHGDRSVIWNVTHQRPYTSIRPDLLVEAPNGKRLTIDTKYKLYDERQITSGDLYQSFLYASTLAPPDIRPLQGMIIYPASGEEPNVLHLRVSGQGSETHVHIYALGLPIPALLREVRQETKGPRSRMLADFLQRCLQS